MARLACGNDDMEVASVTDQPVFSAIYKDRGYQIYDLNDNVKGKCLVDREWKWDCLYSNPDHFTGASILSCTSADLYF